MDNVLFDCIDCLLSCRTQLDLQSIEIDQFMASILHETRSYPSALEVLVDSFGNWRLADGVRPSGGVKREQDPNGWFFLVALIRS